jgi:hypothetical protein
MVSNEAGAAGGADAQDVPWQLLTRSLKAWLISFDSALASEQPRKVQYLLSTCSWLALRRSWLLLASAGEGLQGVAGPWRFHLIHLVPHQRGEWCGLWRPCDASGSSSRLEWTLLGILLQVSDSPRAMQVLSLMQGLVNFMAANDASFMDALMRSDDIGASLRAQGAPAAFISTFQVRSDSSCTLP